MRAPTLLLALVAAAAAQPADFRIEDRKGDTYVVTETELIEGKIRYEAIKGKSKADFGKRKQDFLSLKKWQYDQDCVEAGADTVVRMRDFALATKEEYEEDGKTKKKIQFPHHERKVTVSRGKEGQAVFIEGEQPEDGLEEQGWIDVFPTMLPKDAVGEGKEYEIDAKAAMKAWSRGLFDEKKASGTAKGKYLERVSLGKSKCAKLWVSLNLKGEAKDLPTIEFAVQGFLWYGFEEKQVLKADLGGPITFRMRIKDAPDVGDVDMTVSGTMKEVFVAEPFGR
jgi:hypothetical protein